MTALGIYGTWAVGGIASMLVLIPALLRPGQPAPSVSSLLPRLSVLHGLGRTALGHHALNLALLAPGLCLPVIVTASLSPTVNAYYYTAAMMASLVWAGPAALASMVHAVGVRAPAELGRRTRFSLYLSAAGGAAAVAVVLVGAELLLGLFGPAYAAEASSTLRLLTIGVFPILVKYHYVAIARVSGSVAGAATVLAVGALAEIAGGAIGGMLGGLTGLAWAWLGITMLQAVIVSPAVMRTLNPADNAA
jgi:O-antigen/teichoic acid export membrane protein